MGAEATNPKEPSVRGMMLMKARSSPFDELMRRASAWPDFMYGDPVQFSGAELRHRIGSSRAASHFGDEVVLADRPIFVTSPPRGPAYEEFDVGAGQAEGKHGHDPYIDVITDLGLVLEAGEVVLEDSLQSFDARKRDGDDLIESPGAAQGGVYLLGIVRGRDQDHRSTAHDALDFFEHRVDHFGLVLGAVALERLPVPDAVDLVEEKDGGRISPGFREVHRA